MSQRDEFLRILLFPPQQPLLLEVASAARRLRPASGAGWTRRLRPGRFVVPAVQHLLLDDKRGCHRCGGRCGWRRRDPHNHRLGRVVFLPPRRHPFSTVCVLFWATAGCDQLLVGTLAVALLGGIAHAYKRRTTWNSALNFFLLSFFCHFNV